MRWIKPPILLYAAAENGHSRCSEYAVCGTCAYVRSWIVCNMPNDSKCPRDERTCAYLRIFNATFLYVLNSVCNVDQKIDSLDLSRIMYAEFKICAQSLIIIIVIKKKIYILFFFGWLIGN